MIAKENTYKKLGTLKVVCVGNTSVFLEKHLTHYENFMLSNSPVEPTFWNGTDVGFIVAHDKGGNDSWENFQKEIKFAREQNVITFPIFISESHPAVFDNIMMVNPKHFSGNIELYTYIGESINSIKSFILPPGLVDLNLEDIRSLFTGDGNLAFVYYEYKANENKYIATQKAIEKFTRLGSTPHSVKFMILNIAGSEEKLNMFDVVELSDIIHNEFGNNNCNLIWGANIDDNLTDNIHVSLWLKY